MPPEFSGQWSAEVWQRAGVAELKNFHAQSSEHRPKTQVKLLYDEQNLYVFFRVEDRHVRAVSTRYQDPVYADSCVELFIRPREDKGYFNFEMNCGGTLLLYYIEDARRTEDGFAKHSKVEQKHTKGMRVFHSLPQVVELEIQEPVTWYLEYSIPFSLFEAYLGEPVQTAGRQWRGNFYKCADGSSHPHWGSWAPIGDELNFHQPERFGVLSFEA